MKDLYNGKFSTKKIEENFIRWNDHLCSWIGIINIVKIIMFLKTVYEFNAIYTKIVLTYFTELEKISKTHMELQKTQNNETNPVQKSTDADTKMPDFKINFRVIVTTTNLDATITVIIIYQGAKKLKSAHYFMGILAYLLLLWKN